MNKMISEIRCYNPHPLRAGKQLFERSEIQMQGRGYISHVLLPDNNRNYIVPDKRKTDFFIKQGEYALPYLGGVLSRADDEKTIVETLYILNRMLDDGTKGIDKMYHIFSRFNETKSPNIQTFLAGIYRKTQIPDAFGPLVRMLIQNSIKPETYQYFNPNEEIGGALLAYVSDRFRN